MSGRKINTTDADVIGSAERNGPPGPNGHDPRAATAPVGGNRPAETSVPARVSATPGAVAWVLDGTEARRPDVIRPPGRGEHGGSGDTGVGHADPRAVLLATKLHVSTIGSQLVHRAALLDALSAGLDRRLTLLSAPAGWGKTTLLAQWVLAGSAGRRFSWLSLDTSDNDPVWFWMYAIAALQELNPGVGNRAFELLQMGADPLRVVLPNLLNELAALQYPLVLILDDYHLVASRAVHEQMAFVINRMPTNLHVVMATRSDPALPLARLRAEGDLMEIRTDDLRFEGTEADHLLNQVLGLGLTDDHVQLLCRRTEGWAAGLHLAALSLVGRSDSAAFITTFAGDNRHIVDYLMAEVLEGQPPHLRSFLLRTALLHRLSGDLCDAVLETTGSAAVLNQIERENLFVVPLDSSRHWYRYHQLFGELLRAELHRIAPDLVPELHRRAAIWFEEQGLVDEAVRHLVAAGDIAHSADLIAADWAGEFNAGGVSTVSRYLGLLPQETVSRDPRLTVARIWIALHLGRLDDAADGIETLHTAVAAEGSPTLAAEIAVLRAVHSFKTGDLASALETSRHAITLDLGDTPPGRSSAYCVYGSALYFSGCTDEAQAAFHRSVQLATKADDRRARTCALGYLAMISAEQQQLTEAENHIRRASGSSAGLTDAEHLIDAMVSLATATLLDRRGQSAAALAAADIAATAARQGGAVLEITKALHIKARILEHLGDNLTAEATRDEIDALMRNLSAAALSSTALTSARCGSSLPATSRRQNCIPGEELTPKELEVLRLLATRLSRREIGERLYVSLNTVKSHQRAVYRKLRAENRSTAVSRARELGLL